MTETAVNMGKSATEVKISVKGLKKSFGDNEVLKGLDVDIKSGEVVCVIGPSGSGKSTFLRCLNRLEDITAGSVRVDQFDLTNKDVDIDKVRQHIGMVFQHFNLFPHMSVVENVMLAPVQTGRSTKEQAREIAVKLLGQVGLAEKGRCQARQPVRWAEAARCHRPRTRDESGHHALRRGHQRPRPRNGG